MTTHLKKFATILVALLLFSSCSFSDSVNNSNGRWQEQGHWKATESGGLFWQPEDPMLGGKYIWSGETREGLIHGPGSFRYENLLTWEEVPNAIFFYGIGGYNGNKKNFAFGEKNWDGEINGFGVKGKNDTILIGTFMNGVLNGDASILYKDQPVYRGMFSNGRYNGEGTLYNEAGEIKYAGGFLNGQYEGNGVLYDDSGNLVYSGGFSNGLYNGKGSISLNGRSFTHHWENGQLTPEIEVLISQLDSLSPTLSETEYLNARKRISNWDIHRKRIYAIWISIGGAALLISIFLYFRQQKRKDPYRCYEEPWSTKEARIWWISLGFLVGGHRAYLRSIFAFVYPLLFCLLIILNLKGLSLYAFHSEVWALWDISAFSYLICLAIIIFWIFDFFWIPWRCYALYHKYARSDSDEVCFKKGIETKATKFAKIAADSTKAIGKKVQSMLDRAEHELHNQYQDSRGVGSRLFSMVKEWKSDPWLKFEKERLIRIQRICNECVKTQKDYTKLVEELNRWVEESARKARHNLDLGAEVIKKIKSAQRRKPKESMNNFVDITQFETIMEMDVTDFNAPIQEKDIIKGINLALSTSSALMNMGSSVWAGPIGMAVGVISITMKYMAQAQENCKIANERCREFIGQLRPLSEQMLSVEIQIKDLAEKIIALNQYSKVFWQTYGPLRDTIFGEKPSYYKFRHKIETSLSEEQITEKMKRDLIFLKEACTEYGKLNRK